MNPKNMRARQIAFDIFKSDPADANFVVSRAGNRLSREEATLIGVCVIEDERAQMRMQAVDAAKAQERKSFEAEVLASPEAQKRPKLAREFLADPVISLAPADMVISQLGKHRIDADKAWMKAILASPEGKAKPEAAKALIQTHTSESMPVDKARGFLRGLPSDDDTAKGAVFEAYAQKDTQSLNRRLEIKAAALATRGDRKAIEEAKSIAYAFRVASETRMPLGEVCRALNINV